ncbi:hypothetical protein ACT2CV_03355 [Pasteurellaceae bacterium 22721_9_1]
MKKLIIIRGHSGSGKTTFAKQKMVEFKRDYPEAKIFHVENDRYLSEKGQYIWTEQRFQQAKKKAYQYLQYAFRYCDRFPEKHVLIVISNVGVNVQEIHRTLTKAAHLGLEREVYRMMNFFENQHKVNAETIQSMFNALNENIIEGEIKIKNTAL